MSAVTYSLEEHVATITLNRPDAMNTFNRDMYREFNAATARFRDDDDAWVALITSAGDKAFSAGVDIKDLHSAMQDDSGRADATQHFDIELPGEYFCDKPIIAAIGGYCIGEGLVVAIACDMRICGRNASFCLPESKVGVPTVNGSVLGARLIGTSNILELILTGEHRDAEWALRTGLVNEVVDDDRVLDVAREWAGKIAALSPLANRISKNIAANAWRRTFDESLEIGAERRTRMLDSYDFQEGRRAFIEKRKPNFKGE